MSQPKNILASLQEALRNSDSLAIVDDANILVGMRDNVAQYPSIIIEPIGIFESDIVYGRQRLTFQVAVIGLTQQNDKDLQIEDLLSLENNIKKAIDESGTLSQTVIDIDIKETRYDIIEYPIRSCNIIIEILFQQEITTRT